MKIHFKSGKVKIITKEMADVLLANSRKGNQPEHQTFAKNNKLVLLINFNEVEYID